MFHYDGMGSVLLDVGKPRVTLKRTGRSRGAGEESAMQIGIVGGVERGWTTYERMAAACGHTVELHGGHIRGRGQETLEALVRRSDLLVIVTGINSHAAVQQARKLVRHHGRQLLLLHSFGTSRFVQLLDALEAREAPPLARAV